MYDLNYADPKAGQDEVPGQLRPAVLVPQARSHNECQLRQLQSLLAKGRGSRFPEGRGHKDPDERKQGGREDEGDQHFSRAL